MGRDQVQSQPHPHPGYTTAAHRRLKRIYACGSAKSLQRLDIESWGNIDDHPCQSLSNTPGVGARIVIVNVEAYVRLIDGYSSEIDQDWR